MVRLESLTYWPPNDRFGERRTRVPLTMNGLRGRKYSFGGESLRPMSTPWS
jgi:hypothetical protein